MNFLNCNISTDPSASITEMVILNSKGAKLISRQSDLTWDFCAKNRFSYFEDLPIRDSWYKNHNFFEGISEFAVFSSFIMLQHYLSELPFKSTTFVLTPDASIHATARINDLKFFFEIFFDKNKNEYSEVIFNVFKDKDCIYAHGGSLESVIEKAEDVLRENTHRKILKSYTYELSGSSVTKNIVSNNPVERGFAQLYSY